MTSNAGLGPVRHILIVEDNRGDALLVEVALKEAGLRFNLTHLADGEKAVEYLHQSGQGSPPPDLVFLDLNLPKRNGWEVLQELRSIPAEPPVPVVILSSSSSPEDQNRAQSLGVTKYICKPSTLDEFLAIGQTAKSLLAASG